MIQRVLRTALLVLTMASLSSCVRDTDSIGVRLAGSESLQVVFADCPGDTLTRVALWKVDDDGVVGEGYGDTILWEIVAEDATEPNQFSVGRTPSGWTRSVGLTDYEGEVAELAFEIDASGSGGESVGSLEVFFLSDLSDKTVLSGGEQMTGAGFLEDRRGRCDGTMSANERANAVALFTVFLVLTTGVAFMLARRQRDRRTPRKPDVVGPRA